MRTRIALATLMLLTGCNKEQPRPDQGDHHSPMSNEISATSLPEEKPGGRPPAGQTLAEPENAIDPKSVEAAGQIVQHYGALIEQGRWGEAEALWTDRKSAAGLSAILKPYASVHLQIGQLGRVEGAAGSSYVDMPVSFYGMYERGGSYRRPAIVTLRRVNDVPGSTEEQRRWHIERVEWKS